MMYLMKARNLIIYVLTSSLCCSYSCSMQGGFWVGRLEAVPTVLTETVMRPSTGVRRHIASTVDLL